MAAISRQWAGVQVTYSTSYSYDLMGNMESLTRNGLLDDKSYGKIDDLTYEYNGNQVTKIADKVSGPYYKDAMHFVDGADAEIEYEYDKNGCMTKDLNKNIRKIEYNLLNLPTKLSFVPSASSTTAMMLMEQSSAPTITYRL